MVLAWPAARVGADLGDELQRGLGTDGIDLAQVGADAAGSGYRMRVDAWRIARAVQSAVTWAAALVEPPGR